ncbi:MAG TPA: hypothetical protein PLD59_14190 [Tepidisphaeraceae bacterium]|nr:hypothetical protein [Tepidisphaeraceae bacterium]
MSYRLSGGPSRVGVYTCILAAVLGAAGCGSPSKANIELRKQNQALRDEIEALKRRQTADAATIVALEKSGVMSDQLPKHRLDELFTTAGISLGKLTGGYDRTPATPGDDAIRVQAAPIDLAGEPLKAAGAFKVEAFDAVSSGVPQKIAEWNFSTAEAKAAWLGQVFQYGYLLTCPFETLPAGKELKLRVTFIDALTARELTAEAPVVLAR